MDEAGSNKRFGIYVYLSGKAEFFCGCRHSLLNFRSRIT